MDTLTKEACEVVQSNGGRKSNSNHSKGKFVDRAETETNQKEGKDIEATACK